MLVREDLLLVWRGGIITSDKRESMNRIVTLKTTLPVSDYNQALTFAHEDIKANWQVYRDRYQRWLKQ